MSFRKMTSSSTLSRRRLPALALAATGLLALSACSSGAGPTGSGPHGGSTQNIEMWVAGNNVTKPIYTAEVEAYSKAHPGVNITLTDLPGPQYVQKYSAAAAAGKLPAIFQMPGVPRSLQTLVDGKKVADLSDLFTDGSPLKSRILPVALPAGQIDGKQYGVPYNIFQEAVVLYSKPAFKKAGISSPPTTWNELIQDVSRLKKANIIPISISGTVPDNWYEWWLESYEERLDGTKVFDSIKKGDLSGLNSPAVVKAAKAMQDLVKMNPFEPGYTTTSENNNIPFALLGSNKAGMLLYGAFTPNFVAQTAPGFVKNGQMGWFTFPGVEGGTGSNVVDLGTPPLLLVNSSLSAKQSKAAKDFLASFVYSDEQVASLAKTGNVGPATNAPAAIDKNAPSYLKEYMKFEVDESSRATQAAASWSTYLPPDSLTAWNTLLERLFSLKISPEEFASKAAGLK
jgi:ABC-type glycerol-3-phosphate transport system substrate-binding protein